MTWEGGTGRGQGRKPKDWELQEMFGDSGGQTQGHPTAVVGGQGSSSQSSTKPEQGGRKEPQLTLQPRGLPVAQMKFRVFVKSPLGHNLASSTPAYLLISPQGARAKQERGPGAPGWAERASLLGNPNKDQELLGRAGALGLPLEKLSLELWGGAHCPVSPLRECL